MSEIIGYDRVGKDQYQPIHEPQQGYIYTAAMIACCKCNQLISGMGGPRLKAICVKCATDAGIHNEVHN
jgi:hypothetical protein